MGIIWSYISLAEPAETVALGARKVRTRWREIGKETNRTWFGRLSRRRKVLVIFIGNLYPEREKRREREGA